ncbi:MAG TPA: asparagine synthase (glutamine-hydrolyzing) [Verrucomicrobiae bacterium]|nr:asparagine synthase (glutamine-hydrolyzing) [Verrucomicrobiae bacterium]
MCGIAAIFNYRTGQPISCTELLQTREAMSRRGPDDAGCWVSADGCVGLAHRRLSILDLSPAAAQPMHHADGSSCIVFNGEIYNYRELRAELRAQGCAFQTTSDTEVLLHLYQRHGRDLVHKLRGMYAFALWDFRQRGLLIARDPFGIKPLYISDNGQTFRAASQVKALLAAGAVDTSPEPAGHTGFFLWGHVPSPYTLYRGIRSFPPGTTLWLDANGARAERTFYSIPQILSDAEAQPVTHDSDDSILADAIGSAVRHHLVSDVPVGLFLSAGLDSTTLLALAAQAGRHLRTFTLGFEEYRGKPEDETPGAARTAARYGASHEAVWIRKQDFEKYLDGIFDAMDQPSCDGINTFFASFAAARAGLKVALSGVGGDELLGGYPGFRQIPQLVRRLSRLRPPQSRCELLRKGGARLFRAVSAPLIGRITSPKYAGLLEYGGSWGGAYLLRRGLFMPWEIPLDSDVVREGLAELQPVERLEQTVAGIRSPRLKVAALELTCYLRDQLLRDTDWAGMHHSVEVRTPLVDIELLLALAPLLAGAHPPQKNDLARVPNVPLSPFLLNRAKTGFTVPVRNWLLATRPAKPGRGLRPWTRVVHSRFEGKWRQAASLPVAVAAGRPPATHSGQPATTNALPHSCRVLVLLSDAFGGYGGIAKFNRDFLTALSSSARIAHVTALPRLMPDPVGTLPRALGWDTAGLGGRLAYSRAVFRAARFGFGTSPGVVVCGHLNLLPLAFIARRIAQSRSGSRAIPILLLIHGIEAWRPPRRPLTRRLASRVDQFVAVSEFTKQRFLAWSHLSPARGSILPNCVDLSLFRPAPRQPSLLHRYHLENRTVLMSFGRMHPRERYKGFDELLALLPSLAHAIPNLACLLVGDGEDRPRLEAKARALGLDVISDRPQSINSNGARPLVVFTGHICESEKAAHYRLADVFLLLSRGEGFGIVLLEAMACGVPVIASSADGSREAVRCGSLGQIVDPGNPAQIIDAILRALASPTEPAQRRPPAGLEYFSFENFQTRCHGLFQGK